MKNILIIKCGTALDKICDKHGDFEDWIITQSNLPSSIFKVFDVSLGELLRHPSEYIAAIITGTHTNTNQRLPWIKHLKDWIVTARYSNIPVLGICFGHQIIAEALGGTITQNPMGTNIGVIPICITSEGKKCPIFKNTGNSFESFAFHNYSIDILPIGAKILALDENEMVYSFQVDKMYGVQFHPEFTPIIMQQYLTKGKYQKSPKIRIQPKSEFKNQSILPNFIDLSLKF